MVMGDESTIRTRRRVPAQTRHFRRALATTRMPHNLTATIAREQAIGRANVARIRPTKARNATTVERLVTTPKTAASRRKIETRIKGKQNRNQRKKRILPLMRSELS